MRKTTTLLIALAALIAVPAADAKRSPKAEKLALTAADTKTAKAGLILKSDLSGWKGGPVSAAQSGTPACIGQNYSAFTITGEAEADYTMPGFSFLGSRVEVYLTAKQAMGDFKVGSSTPNLAKCMGKLFASQIDKAAKVISAKKIDAPSIGQRSAQFEFVIRYAGVDIYINLVAFVRGRAAGSLFAVSPISPVSGRGKLLQLMDDRLKASG